MKKLSGGFTSRKWNGQGEGGGDEGKRGEFRRGGWGWRR